jgi:hypothetical protein
MAITTWQGAYRTSTFWSQLVITMIINFGVNFGLEWATMSNWGGRSNTAAWPSIPVWKWSPDLNSCIGLDINLTAFMVGAMCMLLATGGTQKEVREKKCDVLEPAATSSGFWLWTPVRYHRSLGVRSCATGAYFLALVGLPTTLLLWAIVGNGEMNGYTYTVFKGVWAMAMSMSVYALVFVSAIDKRNFPELEFERLMELQAAAAEKDSAPLVGQPALV